LNLKWLLLTIVCFNFLTPTINASSVTNSNFTDNKLNENQNESEKLKKLDELYTKRKALSEAYLEIDQEIFRIQKEILEGIENSP
jgi:molecular chaperone GrpE (heat shock protein)